MRSFMILGKQKCGFILIAVSYTHLSYLFIRFISKSAVLSSRMLNHHFVTMSNEKVGAIILPDIQSVYREAEMIVKVKEPIAEEYPLIHRCV